jgi:Helicase conserved C-terminal domain
MDCHKTALATRRVALQLSCNTIVCGPTSGRPDRERVPVLLCTESGGEGRNIQFCNTLINFDIPWNPMAIEQRIGRIDRIGQLRELFVFNLSLRERSRSRCCGCLTKKYV